MWLWLIASTEGFLRSLSLYWIGGVGFFGFSCNDFHEEVCVGGVLYERLGVVQLGMWVC